jgi:hypothetical protein
VEDQPEARVDPRVTMQNLIAAYYRGFRICYGRVMGDFPPVPPSGAKRFNSLKTWRNPPSRAIWNR